MLVKRVFKTFMSIYMFSLIVANLHICFLGMNLLFKTKYYLKAIAYAIKSFPGSTFHPDNILARVFFFYFNYIRLPPNSQRFKDRINLLNQEIVG